ncbi:MAG: 6-phosphogluconolactonase [Actinomycetales bacterium]|nr:6-phosphogluconolactonase [Actinomycetales bacterium]
MSGVRTALVHPDAEVLAEAVAARLLTRLVDLQSVQETVHLVLTGGTVGIASLAAVAHSPVRHAVDWSTVHVWWGDERFLPTGDPERNETQARDALLDALDALPADNVHPMPAPSDAVGTPEDSAAAYARELAAHAPEGAPLPVFDVVLLGMGPDGHVASLFPGHEALGAGGTVVGVHGSPKPPPQRTSLTFDALRGAVEVWLIVAGAEKAPAVQRAFEGAPVEEIPAVSAVGQTLTLWLLDVSAATPAAG